MLAYFFAVFSTYTNAKILIVFTHTRWAGIIVVFGTVAVAKIFNIAAWGRKLERKAAEQKLKKN